MNKLIDAGIVALGIAVGIYILGFMVMAGIVIGIIWGVTTYK